jgi:hypothetical protein
MLRIHKTVVFLDKDLTDPAKGWGWAEVDFEDVKRFGINANPPSQRTVTKQKLGYDEKAESVV